MEPALKTIYRWHLPFLMLNNSDGKLNTEL